MDHPILTEATLLLRFPPGSRIISPSTITFIKHSDGNWWNWSNNQCTGRTLQTSHVISPGSKAYYPNEGRERYAKHPDGRWLNVRTQPANGAFESPPSMAVGHSAGHHGAAPSDTVMRVILQETYRNGLVPVNDTLVRFDVPVSSAERGDVAGKDLQAFTGELTVKEKVSIRFGFPCIGLSEYRAKQHNLKRGGSPLTRGQLAKIVAEEVKRVGNALAQIDKPIARRANGRPVALEDLILVDVRRVSDGTLQPTIALRSA
ncbi:hypothetical protein V8D89_002612 [Ganoderma adspersum]